ncbi:putative phage tail protein [Yersinia frederiksenii]|nr:putative phage tail protein [Yersinia frederiksenii]
MAWYRTGRASSVAGSNIITGTGTLWASNVFGIAPGQTLAVPGGGQILQYEILAVDSDTKIRIATNATTTVNNSEYAIVTTVANSYSALARQTSANLAVYEKLLSDWNNITTGTGNVTIIAPDGTQVIMPSLNQMNENINSKITQQQLTGVVGTARNVVMNVNLASATAALVANEIIVQTAGGLQYKILNFNKSINLAMVGAGGMNTGTAPANGFVALYAIYNPSSTASALLAVNTTGSVAPEVCGVTMPAGYTASALVSVWRTASSQFVVGQQLDRMVVIFPTPVATGSANITSQEVSLDAAAPRNTKKAFIEGLVNATGSGNTTMRVASSSNQLGRAQSQVSAALVSLSAWVAATNTSNYIYLTIATGAASPSYTLYCNGYSF